MKLRRDRYGNVRFAEGSALTDRQALGARLNAQRRYAEHRRMHERLHAEHIRMFDDGPDPTFKRPATREILHFVPDPNDEEEALWAAWQRRFRH